MRNTQRQKGPVVTNTSAIAPAVNLLRAMELGSNTAIETQEAQGQFELVLSDLIPTDGTSSPVDRAAFAELGFLLGDPVDGDPMFRHCQLPEGWKRVGSDHNMWSYIHDQQDRPRASIFYKAAFYDRSAHISLNRRYSISTKYATGPAISQITQDYGNCSHKFSCVCDADGTILFHPDAYGASDWDAGSKAEKLSEAWRKEHFPDFMNPAAYW